MHRCGAIAADLSINDTMLAEKLDNKLEFLSLCQNELKLAVPEYYPLDKDNMIETLRMLRSQGAFHEKYLFMKPLELARNDRVDFTKIPHDIVEFENFVESHLKHKDLSVPYILNQYIKGQEFAANLICKNGQIFMLQVCLSSPIQTNYISMRHHGIERWVTEFVQKTRLSGLVCFDFLVDDDNNVYCIECNPRLHSAITSFNSPGLVKIF